MRWNQTLRAVWSSAKQTWNSLPRLRLGTVLLAIWYALFIFNNPTPSTIATYKQWAVGFAFVFSLIIGVTLVLDSLIHVIGQWWETPLTNPDMYGDSDDTPDPAPTLSDNGYEPQPIAAEPGFEVDLRGFITCFPLSAIGVFGVFAIGLYRESVPAEPELSVLALLAIFCGSMVGIVVVHEGLHAIVAAAYGADVSFGTRFLSPETRFDNTVFSRRELVLVLAAPSLVITLVAVALALSSSWLLMAVGIIVLLFHTSMLGGDLYRVMRGLSEPPGTKYHLSPEVGEIKYYPTATDSPAQSVLARADTVIARATAPLKIPPLSPA